VSIRSCRRSARPSTASRPSIRTNRADKTIKSNPAQSVLGYSAGDEVRVSEADFVRLAEAFFAEIEQKFT
jgi:hypothetical protein